MAPVREHSRTGGAPRGRETSVPWEFDSLRLRASQVKRRKVHRQGPEGLAVGRNFCGHDLSVARNFTRYKQK